MKLIKLKKLIYVIFMWRIPTHGLIDFDNHFGITFYKTIHCMVTDCLQIIEIFPQTCFVNEDTVIVLRWEGMIYKEDQDLST